MGLQQPIKIESEALQPFYDQNPDFDILHFDFHNQEAISALNISAASMEVGKTYQRLLRLQPDPELAARLQANGFDSAQQIAAWPEHKFVRDYVGMFDNDEALARTIHRRAVAVKTRVKHLWANVKDKVASAHYKVTRFNNIDPQLVDYFQNIPSYQDLFGGLDYCTCEHCKSIFSPAAYFFDMMRVTDEYITEPNLIVNSGSAQAITETTITLAASASDQDGAYEGMYVEIMAGEQAGQAREITAYTGSTRLATVATPWNPLPPEPPAYRVRNIPPGFALQERRPDLFNKLKLDCEQTNTLVPFLQIVNQVLQGRIEANPTYPQAFQALAVAGYPFNLPFNLPLTQIRLYIENLKSSLVQIFRNFETPQNMGVARGGAAASITLAVDASAETDAYATMQLEIVEGTGHGQQRTITAYEGTTKVATVNEAWTTVPDKTSQYVVTDRLDTAREYLKLSLEMYRDLTTPQDTVAGLNRFYGYADTVNPVNTLARVTTFLYRTGLNRDQLQALLVQNLDQAELEANVADRFFINNTGEDLPYLHLVIDESDPDRPFQKIEGLSLKRLDRLNRFIRLATALNWSYADLDWAMTSVGAGEITPAFIEAMAKMKQLQVSTGLPVDVLCSFWHDLKTIGRVKAANPQDLFDRIFNNPALLDGRNPYSDPTVPFNPYQPLSWQIDERTGENDVIRTRLLAALMVSDNDLTVVANYLLKLSGQQGQPLELSLTNLTWLYRLTKLPALFRLTIDESLQLVRLMDWPAEPSLTSGMLQPTVDNILAWQQTANWLKDSPFTVYELQYILTGEAGNYFKPGYSPDDILPLFNSLATLAEGSRFTRSIFEFQDIDTEKSAWIFGQLVLHGFISDIGLSLNDSHAYNRAAPQFQLTETSFITDDIDEAASKAAFEHLKEAHPPLILINPGETSGTLNQIFTSETALNFLFAGQKNADHKRNEVKSILLRVKRNIAYTMLAFLFPITETSFVTNEISNTASKGVFEVLRATKNPTVLANLTYPVTAGIAQGGTASSMTLAEDASSENDAYKDMQVEITAGTGAGQLRTITAYNGTTKVAEINKAWETIPDKTSRYQISETVETLRAAFTTETSLDFLFNRGQGQTRNIKAYDGTTKIATLEADWEVLPNQTSLYQVIDIDNGGTAQGGTASSITLAEDASSANDAYKEMQVEITAGTGAGQNRTITAYDGTSKIATVTPNWTTLPDDTSHYRVFNVINQGIVRGSQKNSVTLDNAASSKPGAYNGLDVQIINDPQANFKRDAVKSILLGLKANISYIVETITTVKALQMANVAEGLAGFLNTNSPWMNVLLPFAAAVVDLTNYLSTLLTPIQDNHIPAKVPPLIQVLSRAVILTNKLGFSAAEGQAVVQNPHNFNIKDLADLTLNGVQSLSAFKPLVKAFYDEDNGLLTYFTLPNDTQCPGPKAEALARLTGWETQQICDLNQIFWPHLRINRAKDDNTVAGIERLKRCFDLSISMGVDIYFLLKLYRLNHLPIATSDNKIIDRNWVAYVDLARSTLDAVNAKYEDVEFADIYQEITDNLDTQKRDALLGFAIWVLGKEFSFITKPSDLYQYLLIDVEMSACDAISYITQGIASIQLYMQRCRMMLEPGVTDIKVPEIWWAWMSNYRIWEVNRKIFLYPENYLEPNLRRNITPLFQKLKDDLLQTNITLEAVTGVFKDYLDGFSGVANLIYCDSYHCPLTDPDTGETTDTLFVFGRTNTEPYTFYYRTYIKSKKLWTAWQKIDLSINAYYISPVYAYDKLFIFWVEREIKEKPKIEGGSEKPGTTAYRATVKYAFYNSQKHWIQSQNLKQEIVIDFIPDDYQAGLYIDPSVLDPEDLYWQKIYVLRVPPKIIKTQEKTLPERILLAFGALYRLPTEPIDVPDKPDKKNYTDIDKYTFDLAIYETAFRANKTVEEQNPRPGFIFLNEAQLITPNLLEETPHLIIVNYNELEGDPQPYRAAINLEAEVLNVRESNNVIYDNYFGDYTKRSSNDDVKAIAEVIEIPLLYNISQANGEVITIKNQPGWFIFNNGDEEFLLTADDPNLKTITGILIEYNQSITKLPNEIDLRAGPYTTSIIDFKDLQFEVYRLTTNTIHALNQKLFSGGLKALLTLQSQQLPELPFDRFYQNGTKPPALIIPDPKKFEKLDFDGSYGLYFWEIFFHAPFLVADQLQAHQRFDEARQWYQYIFNPTQKPGDDGTHPNDRFWRFLPFRNLTLETLTEILRNQAQIAAYHADPFDPDAIARLRPTAYAKAIVMKYIDNLLVWGDNLFAQDTRESITQATNLYVMAADLLGPRPEAMGECPIPDPKTFNQIKQAYSIVNQGTAQGGNATSITLAETASAESGVYNGLYVQITAGTGQGQRRQITTYDGQTKLATVNAAWATPPDNTSQYRVGGIPEFLIQLENTPMVLLGQSEVQEGDVPFNDIHSYFCVPDNAEFIEYWDRVEDRLYKIRHCMNIQGLERQLAQFEPPLDPRALIRAAASGRGGLSVAGQLETPVPYYRFSYMLEKAKSLAANLIQLGSSLLSALEKKDAEALALLRTTQEKALLNLTTLIKEQQLEELAEMRNSLIESQNSAQTRYDYYSNLIEQDLSPGEIANIVAMTTATVFNVLAGVTRTAAAIGYAVPQVGSPFAMTYGGQQIGSTLQAASGAFEIYALLSNFAAQLSLTLAGYQRRAEEWELQQKLADFDNKQIEAQITANQIRRQIAERELQIHTQSIEQNEQMEEFLKSKFTNQELYQWMVGRLSTVYFQTYSLAFDLALSAQRAYQYQYNTDQTFINFGYWDDLHKGLLAGEGLMLALNQLEKTALDTSSRPLEIEKTISLLQLNPKALLDLKTKGECYFEFSEKLFDYDFPGHYARKIKSISISIPAVVGPYQNIKATLTQLSNQTIIKPDVEATNFLLGGDSSNTPGPEVLRSNWWINQQVALSRGINDSGLFELNFQDERYLPFEGTGAVSSWRLGMPLATNAIDFSAISDVIIQLKYTASEGGQRFRQEVTSLPALQPFYGAGFLSLNQQYSQQWYTFLHDHAGKTTQRMTFDVSTNLFRLHLEPKTTKLDGFYFKLEVNSKVKTTSAEAFIFLNVPNQAPLPVNLTDKNDWTYEFPANQQPQIAKITGPWTITFDLNKTPTDLKTPDGYLNPEVIQNIDLILYYEGTVNWLSQ